MRHLKKGFFFLCRKINLHCMIYSLHRRNRESPFRKNTEGATCVSGAHQKISQPEIGKSINVEMEITSAFEP